MSPAGAPLRLLLIEDSEDDAALLVRQLRSAGYQLVYCRVQNARELEEALAEPWDVVISDYHMPGWDAKRALSRIRRDQPDLPFIILSGAIGEEAAVECMRAGANDYLMKDRPAHLPEVIDRELRVVGDRRAQRAAEERRREDEQARLRAEQENLFKSQFLANMSHELRTPLNAVIGFSEILASESVGPLNPEQQDFVGTVLESGRHLLELINDILDLARIEAGKSGLERAPTDGRGICDRVRAMMRPLAAKREVEVRWLVSPELPPLDVDPVRFREILSNLVGNAIKFTPAGGRVDVELSVADGACQLTVADTGVGISADDVPRLFREFERIGPGAREGTGLGLALTRRLVQLHGGEIGVESEPGRGSRFRVKIPPSASSAPRR